MIFDFRLTIGDLRFATGRNLPSSESAAAAAFPQLTSQTSFNIIQS